MVMVDGRGDRMRVALVTGGGRGIGRAIALALAGPDTFVAVSARTSSQLKGTAQEIETRGGQAMVLEMDVTVEASVSRAVSLLKDRAGHIDVLVNNAGIGGGEPVAGSDIARWRHVIDTNLTGMYLVTREAVSVLVAGGRIVNISSVLGRFGVPGYTAYCASKHGVIGFTRALALELTSNGTTVNAVCPGWVDTDMAAEGMRQGATATGQTVDEFRAGALGRVPIGRIIKPDEVAQLVAFLAAPSSSAITGQTYNICGGQTMD
jgi:NAD(P)-dependent dehydrogenase (short-subunit alcohol dehydrogenase family)